MRHTDAILLASAAVRPGEWTTYGEISVAVFGHRAGARAVGQVAARDGRFTNAHRVIGQGGLISKGWGGGGPATELCRRRLEAEGVKFRAGGADPARMLRWRTIEQRMRATPRRRKVAALDGSAPLTRGARSQDPSAGP